MAVISFLIVGRDGRLQGQDLDIEKRGPKAHFASLRVGLWEKFLYLDALTVLEYFSILKPEFP